MNYRVGILGATGMVGQRLISLLDKHPWFKVEVVAASADSAGMTYGEAVKGRWKMANDLPDYAKSLIVENVFDCKKIAAKVDFVFCALDLPHDEVVRLEEMYAKAECPVISNNSANRNTPDVPMIIPEVNPLHSQVIPFQRKRLGTTKGFIAAKCNCSLQTYVPALHPLRQFGLERILACTYQSISGAGKNFAAWPEMVDNIIPLIGGEEEKSENEPLKIFGECKDGRIINDNKLSITTQCIRVPTSDGHFAAVFASFKKQPEIDEIIHIWQNYKGEAQILNLPTAPKQFLHYFKEENYPQLKLHRESERGMAVSIGRLRPDKQYGIKFVCLSHNTVRGAAGGAILMAELLCAQKWI